MIYVPVNRLWIGRPTLNLNNISNWSKSVRVVGQQGGKLQRGTGDANVAIDLVVEGREHPRDSSLLLKWRNVHGHALEIP